MKKAGCDCADKLNEKLAQYNAMLTSNLLASQTRAAILLCKRDTKKRGTLPILEATFCPFCGVKYPKDRVAEAFHKARPRPAPLVHE